MTQSLRNDAERNVRNIIKGADDLPPQELLEYINMIADRLTLHVEAWSAWGDVPTGTYIEPDDDD